MRSNSRTREQKVHADANRHGSCRIPSRIQPRTALASSLAGFGVLDGDLAYVRPTGRVRDVVGSLVVVRVNGKLYLKRLLVAPRGVVMLVSAAGGYEPMVIGKTDAFALLGEVVASSREYAPPS